MVANGDSCFENIKEAQLHCMQTAKDISWNSMVIVVHYVTAITHKNMISSDCYVRPREKRPTYIEKTILRETPLEK